MTEREALKLALEFTEEHLRHWTGFGRSGRDVVAAIKEALAQHDSVQDKPEPEQEPVVVTYQEVFEAMQALYNGTFTQQSIAAEMGKTKLYTAPPQREWQDLTDDEWQELADKYDIIIWSKFRREIEARLKEKNT